MPESTSRLIAKRTSGWPVLVVVFAMGVYLLPGMSSALVYDRSAIISGELWRLITGHWVHFSLSHLFYDVTLVAITSWFIKSLGYRYLTQLYLLTSMLISLVMFVILPDMAFYGGLSGIAIASTVYLSLQCLHEPSPWNRVGFLIFILCISKLYFDASVDQFALVDFNGELVVPVYLSHFTGAVCGILIYLWSAINRPRLYLQPEQT